LFYLEFFQSIEEEPGGILKAFPQIDGVLIVLMSFDLIEVVSEGDEVAREALDGS
jgi:hypothetical protein